MSVFIRLYSDWLCVFRLRCLSLNFTATSKAGDLGMAFLFRNKDKFHWIFPVKSYQLSVIDFYSILVFQRTLHRQEGTHLPPFPLQLQVPPLPQVRERIEDEKEGEMWLWVGGDVKKGCLTSQQHAGVSQGWICLDSFTCCHIEIAVADQTFYLTHSQYTDTGPTNPSADPFVPGAWQGSQWNANF